MIKIELDGKSSAREIKDDKETIKHFIKNYFKKRSISQTFLAEQICEDEKKINKVLNLKLLTNKRIIVKILLYLRVEFVYSIYLLSLLGVGLSILNEKERTYIKLLTIAKEVDLETIRSL